MKILLYSDVHWSTTSSIIRQRGQKYSTRLDILINSMNWAEMLADKLGCSNIICAGDFFDKNVLTDEEVSAINEISWSRVPHIFIVGNHESSKSMLQFNTTSMLLGRGNIEVISEQGHSIIIGRTQIHFMPYVVESDRKNLAEYLYKEDFCERHIVVSHNDIMGINYGGFESKSGFSLDEIEKECTMYLNGHLHNGGRLSRNAFNLGSLTAHNFTNDSDSYEYGCWVLDTDSLELEFYRNPYGMLFYKRDIESDSDYEAFASWIGSQEGLSVISVRCHDRFSAKTRDLLTCAKNAHAVLDFKMTLINDSAQDECNVDEFSMNHLEKFCECVHESIGNSDIIEQELKEVCRQCI